MSDDKMFDYILARSRTRESSILTIATIASSASLVLLTLFIQPQTQVESSKVDRYTLIQTMGFLFPLAGIVYREVTKYGIHRNDERWLKACVKNCRKECLDMKDEKGCGIEDPLCHDVGKRTREVALRSLLLMPILAWWFITFGIDSLFVGLATLMYVGYSIALSSCEKKYA